MGGRATASGAHRPPCSTLLAGGQAEEEAGSGCEGEAFTRLQQQRQRWQQRRRRRPAVDVCSSGQAALGRWQRQGGRQAHAETYPQDQGVHRPAREIAPAGQANVPAGRAPGGAATAAASARRAASAAAAAATAAPRCWQGSRFCIQGAAHAGERIVRDGCTTLRGPGQGACSAPGAAAPLCRERRRRRWRGSRGAAGVTATGASPLGHTCMHEGSEHASMRPVHEPPRVGPTPHAWGQVCLYAVCMMPRGSCMRPQFLAFPRPSRGRAHPPDTPNRATWSWRGRAGTAPARRWKKSTCA